MRLQASAWFRMGIMSAVLWGIWGVGIVRSAEIRVGMSTALEGPASTLGRSMQLGIQAYFTRVNDAPEILQGHSLRLVILDDGSEASRTAANMHKLLDEERVVAVVGNVGTAGATVAVPIANEKETLLFGVLSGAKLLRKVPPDRYVMNYRAGYAEETAAMINGLLDNGITPEEIAFFSQNDRDGRAGYEGAMKALTAKGYLEAKKLPHGRYAPETLNVENALATILGAMIDPKAIVMIGATEPSAKFIKLAKEDLPDTLFLSASTVESQALAAALGNAAEGLILTHSVPNLATDLPAVQDYMRDIKNVVASAAPDFVSLEGYLVAKLFVEGIKRAGSNVTRAGLIDALEGIQDLDIGIGVNMHYSKTDHQASHTVWPTVITKGQFVSFDWANLRR